MSVYLPCGIYGSSKPRVPTCVPAATLPSLLSETLGNGCLDYEPLEGRSHVLTDCVALCPTQCLTQRGHLKKVGGHWKDR